MEQRVDKIQNIQFSKREETLTKLIFPIGRCSLCINAREYKIYEK